MGKGASNQKNSGKDPGRLTIGVMIDNVDDDFQRAIWAGVEEAAKTADVNVVNFLGGDLDPADESTHLRSNIFKLISPLSLDGLVVASTVMATHIGNERLKEYCQRFEPLPMVSLGFRLEGIASVLVDNQFGLQSIMDHLINDHGYRKFLYIGGTLTNADSVERRRIFVETLAAHDIPLDPDLMTRADFRPLKAYEVVREALEKRREFEVIVCANDEMAIAAMKALQERNILVPNQVAVTGFDDIIKSRYLVVPLTTVRQPIFEISKRAAELLLSKIRKEQTQDLVFFSTELMIRRSCGCFSQEAIRAGISEKKSVDRSFEVAFASIKKAVFREMGKTTGSVSVKNEADLFDSVLDAFCEELRGGRPKNHFLSIMTKTLQQSSLRGIDDAHWENLISSLRKAILPFFADQSPALMKAENLLHQARVMIKDMAKQAQSGLRFQLANKTQTLQFVIDALISSFDVPTLLDNMARELPRIGIKSCYLSVHASLDKAFEEACLLLAYDENGRGAVGKDGLVYPAKLLFPRDMIKGENRYNLIIQPLVFREEQMGFIALEFNPLEEISSLALAEQIRSALKASMMMQEIMEKDKKLSDLDRLKNDFIANITHDFRSLITIVLNSAKLGLMYDKPEDFDEVMNRYNIIYNASLKLKTTIDRLLDLAKMDALGIKLHIQKLNIVSYLDEIVQFYRSAAAASRIRIESRLPSSEINDFYTDGDKLEEIMHNLISNALKFVDPDTGVITVSLADHESTVEITIADNGIGIPRDKLEIIFGRFEQLEDHRNARYEGTGIGLAFVKELTRYLRGLIRAESEGALKGTRFILELKKGKNVYHDLKINDEEEYRFPAFSKRYQVKRIIESNINGNLQKDELFTFITERNRENEFDPHKGVILIVDDDPAIRQIVREYLVRAGYKNFIMAANGRSAIDAIYQYHPDLIISDYNMPRMRGDEMHDIIAAHPHFQAIPILFLTVMTDQRIIQERKEKGSLTFLTKPIDEREFLVSVDIYMKKYMEYLRLSSQT
jgi:DNA-binding LacI/PurR family transcriptional regulator/signal transduction histidine kinase/CheY-like chemotaxis protein